MRVGVANVVAKECSLSSHPRVAVAACFWLVVIFWASKVDQNTHGLRIQADQKPVHVHRDIALALLGTFSAEFSALLC